MTRYVFDFSEGNASQRDLLGGKGANLAEMTKRRLLSMFSTTVLGVERAKFDEALDGLKDDRDAGSDLDLTADDFRELVATYKKVISRETGSEFPQSPREQLDRAVLAVFSSWNTERAAVYRRRERI